MSKKVGNGGHFSSLSSRQPSDLFDFNSQLETKLQSTRSQLETKLQSTQSVGNEITRHSVSWILKYNALAGTWKRNYKALTVRWKRKYNYKSLGNKSLPITHNQMEMKVYKVFTARRQRKRTQYSHSYRQQSVQRINSPMPMNNFKENKSIHSHTPTKTYTIQSIQSDANENVHNTRTHTVDNSLQRINSRTPTNIYNLYKIK